MLVIYISVSNLSVFVYLNKACKKKKNIYIYIMPLNDSNFGQNCASFVISSRHILDPLIVPGQ